MKNKREIKTYKLIMWDWKETIDIENLQSVILKGYKYLRNVETGTDDYAIVCTKKKITQKQAQAILNWEFEHEFPEDSQGTA